MATANGNTTTTDYANGYVYQDGDLEFFGIEEGQTIVSLRAMLSLYLFTSFTSF